MKKATLKKTFILLFTCLCSINIFGQLTSIQWQKPFGGGLYDYAKEITNTLDGGSITAGYSESTDGNVSFNHGAGDCWIVKTNSLGTIEWEKTYGGTGFDYAYSIKQTSDGGYIFAGYTESTDGDITSSIGGGDCWIIKLNSTGTILWQKTFGGTSSDNAQCIRQTIDGGYIICGYSESFDGDVIDNRGGGDCWIIKLDDLGTTEWTKTLGGTSYDFAQDIKQTSDGGYILSGGTNSTDGDVNLQNGNGDCWIVKLDYSGNIIWQKSFGGSNYDFAQSVVITDDGGYILAGYTESGNGDITGYHGAGDCWVVKFDNLGNIQWQKSLGSSGNDYAFCIQQLTSGGYILTGYSESNDGDVVGNHGNYDCWVVQLDEYGTIQMQSSFGGTGVDIGYSIKQTSVSTFIIAGYTESNDGDVSGNNGGGDCWVINMKLPSVGFNESVLGQTISVSPTISSENFNFYGMQNDNTIEIFNVTGKLILKTKTNSPDYSLNLADNAKGIYFYKVSAKNEMIGTGKIILK